MMAAVTITDGEIGVVIRRTIVDEDGVVVNLSSLATKKIHLTDPSGTTVTRTTATYPGGGTDGIVQYILVSGDITAPGGWQMQFSLENGTTAIVKTPIEKFEVGKKLA